MSAVLTPHPGDVIFGLGALSIGLFMVGLLTGHAVKDRGPVTTPGSAHTDQEEPAAR